MEDFLALLSGASFTLGRWPQEAYRWELKRFTHCHAKHTSLKRSKVCYGSLSAVSFTAPERF